jgi:NADPH:quinone reductase-like Zn-dependent oxidoreductase
MRAAAFTELVGPDGVDVVDLDDPTPGEGEAVVDVRACSINHHDLWILEGDSSMVTEGSLPFVSGLDVAGVVHEAGPDAGVEEGDRVVLCPNETCGTCRYCREGPENLCRSFSLYHGGLAERATVEAARLIDLPESVSFVDAAALPTAYLTAWHMMRKADVGAGDLVFVPGATGGVGVACIQLCDLVGARTIGTSTSAGKLDRLAGLGCDHRVGTADPEEMVREVRSVGRTDAVLNHLAGEYVEAGLKLLRRGGTQVVCGRTAGRRSEFGAAPFFLQHQEILGSTMGTQPELGTLVGLVADGDLEPVVGGTYPLAGTDEAFGAMADRSVFGKLVVEP